MAGPDYPPETASQTAAGGGAGGVPKRARGGDGGGGNNAVAAAPAAAGGGGGGGGGGAAFRKQVVCVSGFPEEAKVEIRGQVVGGGGEFTNLFTTRVACLVCAKVGTDKYRRATELGIPVVSAEWIAACLTQGKVAPYKPHLLAPLHQLVVTTTGFNTEEKEEIEALILKLGGVYKPDMARDDTDVVIAKAPEGSKYAAALEWGTAVVSRPWLHACEKERVFVDPRKYPVKPPSHSPPPLSKARSDGSLAARPAGGGGGGRGLKRSHSLIGAGASSASTATAAGGGNGGDGGASGQGGGGAAANKMPRAISALVRPEALLRISGGSLYATSAGGSSTSSRQQQQQRRRTAALDLGDEETGAALLNGGVEQQDGGKGGDGDGDAAFVARFKAGRLRTSLALGGCIVFVAGGERCEAPVREALAQLLRRGGATVAMRVDSSVTHVVVAHASFLLDRNVQALLKHPTSPLVLTRDWLLESVASKTPLPPEPRFLVLAPAFSYNQQQQQPPPAPAPPADGSLLGFALATRQDDAGAPPSQRPPGGSDAGRQRGLQQQRPFQRSTAAAPASAASSSSGARGAGGGGASGPFSPRGLLRRSNTIGAFPSSTAPAALDRHHQKQPKPPQQQQQQEAQAQGQDEGAAAAAAAMDADTEEDEEESEEQEPPPPPPPPIQSVFARPQPVRALKTVTYRPGSAGSGIHGRNAPAGFISSAARGAGRQVAGEEEGKRRRSAFDSALRSRVDSQAPGGHGSMAEESQVIGYGEG